MDKEKYLKNPVECPYCDSHSIYSKPIQGDGKTAYADVRCDDCGNSWRDIYTLTDVTVDGD